MLLKRNCRRSEKKRKVCSPKKTTRL